MENIIGKRITDKYEILKKIGQGGMSDVYLALNKETNKVWAVKIIKTVSNSETAKLVFDSLISEAKIMSQLSHPCLPFVDEIIEDEDKVCIVMEYIEGKTLDKYVKENGVQSEETVIEWGKQLCDVLNYLHTRESAIIYRDMKPSNIMMEFDGKLRLIDFGIAREYKEENFADTTILGTKGFAPPEQYGARQTDERSDIYALGMTLHYFLTGEDPRVAGYVYDSVTNCRPELSEDIGCIIDKCTSLYPEERYQSCMELRYDLENGYTESEVNHAFINKNHDVEENNSHNIEEQEGTDATTLLVEDMNNEDNTSSQFEEINSIEDVDKTKGKELEQSTATNKKRKAGIIILSIIMSLYVIVSISLIAKYYKESKKGKADLQQEIEYLENVIEDLEFEIEDLESDLEYYKDHYYEY